MRPKLARGEEIEVTVDNLAYGGRGVARHGPLVVFVARALPGDRVRARVTKLKRRHAEALTVELLESGPDRVTPRCQHFGVCGGCAWQDLDYDQQLHHKQSQVDESLRRLGKLEGYELEPIIPAEHQYGYRNKVEFSWLDTPEGPALGFHRLGRWDELLAIETCHIASDGANDVRRAFEQWARGAGTTAFDRRRHEGYLRHLVVREGVRTGEFLAMLVTSKGPLPAQEQLIELLPPGVVGVLHAQQETVGETTANVEPVLIHGRDWFEERIGGLSFHVTAGAFMQTNTIMCERLYEVAIDYASINPDDIVWDLYCGGGAIGLQAASAGATAVYGIDLSAESIVQARENAERNEIATAEFVEGDVAKEVRPLLERVPRPTLAFVDPPRAGLSNRAVRRLIELAPERIVYVSCNPTTLAPNARQLVDAGYVLERVRPVDMFPHTPHIECVAAFRSSGVIAAPD
jgi:23S rRNA (uracil1939-C5)-methyltransferase